MLNLSVMYELLNGVIENIEEITKELKSAESESQRDSLLKELELNNRDLKSYSNQIEREVNIRLNELD